MLTTLLGPGMGPDGQQLCWSLLALLILVCQPCCITNSSTQSVAHIWSSFPSHCLQADIGRIRQVYDAFLAEYPLCYGYWKKYADAEAKYVSLEEASTVYDRGVAAVPYSVDLWGHYAMHKQKAGAAVEEIERSDRSLSSRQSLSQLCPKTGLLMPARSCRLAKFDNLAASGLHVVCLWP